MLAAQWLRSGCVGFATLAITVLVRCSSPAEDGGSCSTNGDCTSSRCASGACEGSDCQCQGADCRGQSSCLAGWLCTRGDALTGGEVIPQCRQQCGGPGSCPSGKACVNGVCRTGAEPFSIAWTVFPRTVACASKLPCKYAVKVADGTAIETFSWKFGDAPPVDTKDPMTEFTYAKTGTYLVSVRAKATTGATADLTANEILCDGVRGSGCDPNGAPCCEGGCNAQSLCQ